MESLDMPVGQLEGSLPPCLKGVAIFGQRQGTWHDAGVCPGAQHQGHHVCWGTVTEERAGDDFHPPLKMLLAGSGECHITDDPKEAERLWLEAQEVLRNGGNDEHEI